jgi:branched-chain amino acid transport system substrate-binding protein
VKKVAILKDVRNDYSVGLAKNFIDAFTKAGGQIVAQESYSNGDVDFKAQLTNIKALAPQALYVPGYYTDVGLVARQAREVGITAPLLGGDGWDSEKLYEIGGDAIVGSYFSNHYSPDDPSPRIQEFVAKYKKAYGGQTPDSLAAQAYDAAGMLVDAMKRAKDLTGPSIRDALAATKEYVGVTGNITLDQNRNPLKPAVVLKVAKGGKYDFVTKIYPEGMQPESGSGGDSAAGGTKTGGNTAPAPASGSTPTPTTVPATGASTSASEASNTGQKQGVPAAEHPKK